MTIQILDSWLREFVQTEATVAQIAEALSSYSASVERLEKVKKDWIYHIEITTNRIDMVSVQGTAREAVACLKRENLRASFIPLKLPSIKTSNKSLTLEIKNDPTLCRRVTAVLLEDIQMKPSPSFVQQRLAAAGVRALNNIVDVTNYVMLEVGHPTHVFDYDRINTRQLIIRTSKKGEKIITFDGKEYTLAGGDTVIDDGTGEIIDLPGIMGTENSVVTSETKRVLFFIENNDPDQMRKTIKKLGIRTLAGTINEKGVDPSLAKQALYRGIDLFRQFSSAKVASQIFDTYPHPPKIKKIRLDKKYIDRHMGVSISIKKIKEMLTPLQFQIETTASGEKLTIKPPSWRAEDIKIPRDVIEEISRMYGYNNIPSVLPPLKKIPPSQNDRRFFWQEKVKDFLQHQGFHETYTYSLISKELTDSLYLNQKSIIKLANPLTEDQQFLRPSLAPSLLSVIAQNQKKERDLSLFELANIYLPTKRKFSLPRQIPELCLATTAFDLSKMKEMSQLLLEYLGIEDYGFTNQISNSHLLKTYFIATRSGEIAVKNNKVAVIGELSPTVREKLSINKSVVMADFNFLALSRYARKYKTYRPLTKYPPTIEDLTFTMPRRTPIGSVINLILTQSELVKKVKLLDEYQANITLRITYQHRRKTLTRKDVERVRKKIIKAVEKEFACKLKANLR